MSAIEPSQTTAAPAGPRTTSAACSHCGLPVPHSLLSVGEGEQFCCSGCRVVHRALQQNGLLSYYDKRAAFADDEASRPALATGGDYAHFDDPSFIQTYAAPKAELLEMEFYLEGLHCPACIWLVEKLPSLLDGVGEARSSYAEGRLRVLWDPSRVALSQIARTLDSLGYPPHPAGQGRSRELQRKVDRALLVRIGVAAAAFGNVMLLSFALYSGQGMSLPFLNLSSTVSMNESTVQFFRWLSLGIAVPAVLWTAMTFFRGGLAALRTWTPHMDLPVSIGILAALGWGTYATFSGNGEIYFDTVTMLVFLLLVGRWLQSRQQRAANEATDLMFALAPSSSRVVEADGVREVPTDSVKEGALIEVRSGDRVGVDGTVLEGRSKLDESLLSGESAPVEVGPGSTVSAGTVNLSSRLLIRALRTGRDTRLSQLVKEVEVAASRKAPVVLFADRMSGIFVVVVMSLAALTVALWGVAEGLPHAIALLIVTCPCALGLATPLAASVALGRAAKRGVLVKGMQYIEALAKPGLIVFDKTGTLTAGCLSVVEFDGDRTTAALVKALEQRSAHPIAAAFIRDLPLGPALPVEEFEEERGGASEGSGVRGRVNNHDVRVGNESFVRSAGVSIPGERTAHLVSRGLSPVYVAVDGRIEAVAGIGDAVRPEAAACLGELHALGYRLALLSGDRQEVVEHVTSELGVHFEVALGQQSPEDKLRYVEQARERGVVYMVGDGVNDAAALAAATVGIAVHGGAEASLAAADVFTTRGGLSPLVMLTHGARKTLGVIRRNLVFSLLYNLTAAGLAVAGLITPLVAAILMPLSSLTVLTNSLRAKTFEDVP